MTPFKLHQAPMSKRGGKWIDELRPDMPVSKAARKTLRRRLRPVFKLLGDAAQSADESTEHVHQLRVATRRAMAALEGYAELLPRKKTEKLTKRLGKIRKAAGDARDCDVLIERLSSSDAGRWEPLIARIKQLRDDSQEPIVRLYHKLKTKDFEGSVRKLIDKLDADDDETSFLQWARHGMSRTVEAFFTAGAADLNDTTLLHQFRIEGKHLRYALEYFSAAFGPELRNEVYPEVEKIQSLLGDVNDHASAIEHLDQWWGDWDEPDLRAQIDELLAAEREALRESKQEFFRWWTTQRSADMRRRFKELLQLPDEEHAA